MASDKQMIKRASKAVRARYLQSLAEAEQHLHPSHRSRPVLTAEQRARLEEDVNRLLEVLEAQKTAA